MYTHKLLMSTLSQPHFPFASLILPAVSESDLLRPSWPLTDGLHCTLFHMCFGPQLHHPNLHLPFIVRFCGSFWSPCATFYNLFFYSYTIILMESGKEVLVHQFVQTSVLCFKKVILKAGWGVYISNRQTSGYRQH